MPNETEPVENLTTEAEKYVAPLKFATLYHIPFNVLRDNVEKGLVSVNDDGHVNVGEALWACRKSRGSVIP